MLAAPDQRGQGRAETPEVAHLIADRLAAVERHAVSVRAWNPQMVPDLLQTVQYAAAVIQLSMPALPVQEAQRRAVQRARRVQAFHQRWAQHASDIGFAWFIVGESALRRPLTRPCIHAGQLRRLLDLAELPKVQLQVLPDEVPALGRLGHFGVYGLQPSARAPEPGELPGTRVCYLETPVGSWYTTRREDVARLYSEFSDMISVAYDFADSRGYLEEELARWTVAPATEQRS